MKNSTRLSHQKHLKTSKKLPGISTGHQIKQLINEIEVTALVGDCHVIWLN
jgi:hypothetical protein